MKCDCECNVNGAADIAQKAVAIVGGVGAVAGGLALTILTGGLGIAAGGALMGVVSAIQANFGINFVNKEWFESHSAEAVALLMLGVLCGYELGY